MYWFSTIFLAIKDISRESSLDILYIVSIFSIFYVMINYARILYYELNIENTIKIIKNKTEKIRQEGISQAAFEGRVKNLDEQKQLEKLERKRKIILERLPFIKN